MKPKKRLSKSDPNYFVPLPYAMAVKRVFKARVYAPYLFEGMQLELKKEGVVNTTIAVLASIHGTMHTLGYIPKGMVTRIEGLMEHEESIVVSLERLTCERLKNSLWICFDRLPDLKMLGFKK